MIPCIIASASKKAGRDAGTTAMPMLSAAMYLSQFSSPFIMSVVKTLFGRSGIAHLPFWFAALGRSLNETLIQKKILYSDVLYSKLIFPRLNVVFYNYNLFERIRNSYQ